MKPEQREAWKIAAVEQIRFACDVEDLLKNSTFTKILEGLNVYKIKLDCTIKNVDATDTEREVALFKYFAIEWLGKNLNNTIKDKERLAKELNRVEQFEAK